MSFLKELQLQHGALEVPHVSLEEINISLEGLSISKIKELVVKGINKVIEFFIKIFKWIREKVLTFLKSKRTKEIIEKAKVINNIEKEVNKGISVGGYGEDKNNNIKINKSIFGDIYTDDDIVIYIESFFDIYSRKSKIINLATLFSKDGKLIDINKIYLYLDKAYSKIADIIKLINSDKDNIELDNILNNSNDFFNNILKEYESIFNHIVNEGSTEKYKADVYFTSMVSSKLTKEEVFKWTENNYFEKLSNETESFYKKKENDVSKLIDKLKKELRVSAFGNSADENDLSESARNNFERKRKIINYLYTYLKMVAIPVMISSTYIQLLDYICNKFSSKEYLIDPNPPKYKHLYHLSDDENLTTPVKTSKILTPLIPKSGLGELLPPRISFSEDVISCCFGVPRYFEDKYHERNIKQDPNYDPKKGIWKDLWLYEGIQTPHTQLIKPAILQAYVGDYNLTKEICVLNNIRVNKVGKVRIWYNPNLAVQDDRKFVNWTFI